MKLITLNIWGGHVYQPLLDFFKKYQEVDIFCLQEVYHRAPERISKEERFLSLNIFDEILHLLPNHQGFFRPTVKGVYGIGTLIKKNMDVLAEGEILIHDNPDYDGTGPKHPRNLQWLECRESKGAKVFSVLNIHGLWNGLGKTDTEEREAQSYRVRNFLDCLNTPKILCGDFNLRPDTKSLKIISEGLIDLIQEYEIKSTRTSLYPKEEKYADYIFTSPEGINIKKFEVLKDEVSDHAGLFLEFD